MSYTVPPAAADPRQRPGTVTAASYLLYIAAAVQVISAFVALSTMSAQRRAVDNAYADFPDLKDTVSNLTVGAIVVGAVVGLLLAAGFVTLGVLNGRGKNVARIITWVIGGLAVCCFGGGIALGATGASNFGGGASTTNAPKPEDVQKAVNAELPSWYTGVTTLLGLIGLIAVLGAIVLLLLPPSNAFFRKPDPGLAIPGYPGDPAYPGYPGGGAPSGGPAYPNYPADPGYPGGGTAAPPAGGPGEGGPASGGLPPAGMPPGGDPAAQPPSGGLPPADPSGPPAPPDRPTG